MRLHTVKSIDAHLGSMEVISQFQRERDPCRVPVAKEVAINILDNAREDGLLDTQEWLDRMIMVIQWPEPC